MSPRPFLTGDPARDQRNVSMLLGAVEELCGSADLETLVRRAVERAVLLSGAQRGALLLAAPDGRLSVRTARDRSGKDLTAGFTFSRTVADRVWRTREPHVTVDAAGAAGAPPGASIHALRLLSVLAAPLVVKDRALGVLYVDSTAAVKEFTEGDRALFEALAGLVAVAHDQAERSRLAAELEVARSVQAALLPAEPFAPQGCDVAAAAHPCVETMGDYYDSFPLDDGATALVVGDVSGHGLPAALFMMTARAILRTTLRSVATAPEAFVALNEYFVPHMPSDAYMTLFVGLVAPDAGSLRWMSAGHNPPMLRGADGTVRELPLTGTILGKFPGVRHRVDGPVPLGPGDALLLYTDGLFESRDAGGELWGEDRLREAFARRAAAGGSSRAVLEGLFADLRAHVGSRPMDDDVTALLLRVVGTGLRP